MLQVKLVKERVLGVLCSGALVVSVIAAPATAMALDPSVGSQSSSGTTDVTVQLRNGSAEVGGTEDPLNPDDDGDGYGDNIAVSYVSAINFVATSDGTLIGPDASVTCIENESPFPVYASSMQVDAESEWNVVEDATASSVKNAVDFQFGPEGDLLNASSYLTKAAVTRASKWNMTARVSGDAIVSDRVQLESSGHVNNVSKDIAAKTKIASIHAYVKPGIAS